MKAFLLVILTFFCFTFNIFSEEIFLLEEENIYGGKTFERIYNEQEQQVISYSKLIQYFDNNDIIIK